MSLFENDPIQMDDSFLADMMGSPRFGTPFLTHVTQDHLANEDDLERYLRDMAEIVDAEEEKDKSGRASVTSDGKRTGPFVAGNNKRDLDAKWSHLDDMPLADLKQYIRQHRLDAESVAAINQGLASSSTEPTSNRRGQATEERPSDERTTFGRC